MRNLRPKCILERGALADLWRNTLSQIPSVFGRMVYLAALRNTNTGVYEHHGLSLVFGDDEADRALRISHKNAFAEWLGFTLEQQTADLALYLSALVGNRKVIIENWIRVRPYMNLVPASARNMERDLYGANLDAMLCLLKNEHGVSLRDRDA